MKEEIKEEMNNEENEKAMKNFDWKGHIRDVYKDMSNSEGGVNFIRPCADTETFLSAIWQMSDEVLEGMEVQVVIDDKDDLYISSGTPAFVSFQGHEDELTNGEPMRIPIKSWIHTHPFGEAYLSSTDWRTVNTWNTMMKSAIVLGDNQYLAVNMNNEQYEKGTYSAKKVFYGLIQQTVFDDIEPTMGGEE
jgi:proteasome lid subunit RPN8/RPN11